MKDMIEGLPSVAKGGIAGTLCLVVLYLVWLLGSGVASAADVAALKTQHESMLGYMQTQVKLTRLICEANAKTEAMELECKR